SWIQQVKLSRHLLLSERFTKRVVKTAKRAERLLIAKQIPDPRMLFPLGKNHHQHLATCAQPGQTRLEVSTDRVELYLRQKSVVECGFAQAAQQRTPVIVRAERMIGGRSFVVLPSAGHFTLESRHGFIGPGPVAQQASETVDRRVPQRS